MSGGSSTRRPWQFIAALTLVTVGVWAGRWVHSQHARPSTAAVGVPAGEASAPSTTDLTPIVEAPVPVPAQIPTRLPNFTLTDPAGKATSITAFAGQSLVLNFWATWCAPCRREIPLLMSIDGEWRARHVTVVGIAVDHRSQVAAYAAQLKIPYPLMIGEQDALDVAAAFGVETPVFPFTVFTDRRGEVVALYVGELHRPQADLILSIVDTLNKDQVPLAAGRRMIADGLRSLAAHG